MAYRAVLYGVSNGESEFYIGDDYSEEELKRIMYAFIYDYPEYFWCLQYKTKIIANKSYYIVLDTDDSQMEVLRQLEEEAAGIVKELSEGSGKYKTVKAIFDYIVNNTEYVENVPYHQDIRSVLLNHQSVCSGYAKTFQYFCKLAGIPCTTVNGYAYEDGDTRNTHAWNLVNIKGNYYWVDVTWGDSYVTTGEEYVNYSYFMVTDDDFLQSHIINESLEQPAGENTLFEYPACTDNSLNYFVKNGCYFKSYRRAKIRKYIMQNIEKDRHQYITLKFAGKKGYQKAYQDLFEDLYIETIIRDCISGNTRISYSYSYDEETDLIFFCINP